MTENNLNEKLNELEKRLSTLEDLEQIQERQQTQEISLEYLNHNIYKKLLEIQKKMILEENDYDKIKNERDLYYNENKQLHKEIEKLNYRINHLIKALNEEELK